ncbi:hypothetical protein C8R45DRAFT_1189665 [Mycena sanguinolenta]|nr:hypothetical protein C8R45DRAFT_1189665 [Mycena sanguinolenta]
MTDVLRMCSNVSSTGPRFAPGPGVKFCESQPILGGPNQNPEDKANAPSYKRSGPIDLRQMVVQLHSSSGKIHDFQGRVTERRGESSLPRIQRIVCISLRLLASYLSPHNRTQGYEDALDVGRDLVTHASTLSCHQVILCILSISFANAGRRLPPRAPSLARNLKLPHLAGAYSLLLRRLGICTSTCGIRAQPQCALLAPAPLAPGILLECQTLFPPTRSGPYRGYGRATSDAAVRVRIGVLWWAARRLAVVLPQPCDLYLLLIASTNSLFAMSSQLLRVHRLRRHSLDRGQWRASSDHDQRPVGVWHLPLILLTRRTLSRRFVSNSLPSGESTPRGHSTHPHPALTLRDGRARRDCGAPGCRVDVHRIPTSASQRSSCPVSVFRGCRRGRDFYAPQRLLRRAFVVLFAVVHHRASRASFFARHPFRTARPGRRGYDHGTIPSISATPTRVGTGSRLKRYRGMSSSSSHVQLDLVCCRRRLYNVAGTRRPFPTTPTVEECRAGIVVSRDAEDAQRAGAKPLRKDFPSVFRVFRIEPVTEPNPARRLRTWTSARFRFSMHDVLLTWGHGIGLGFDTRAVRRCCRVALGLMFSDRAWRRVSEQWVILYPSPPPRMRLTDRQRL